MRGLLFELERKVFCFSMREVEMKSVEEEMERFWRLKDEEILKLLELYGKVQVEKEVKIIVLEC